MRISKINSTHAPAELKAIYDRWFQQRGNVPNMFRVMAHRPQLLQTMEAHMRCVLGEGAVSTRLKELIAVRVSQMNQCDY